MLSFILVTVCVALTSHTVSAQDANVVSAVSCLTEWWSTNKDALLESPENQPLEAIMDNLNVEWLSDPFAQLALDSGMGNIEQNPRTKEIGKQGFKCIECIRQLAIPPKHCRQSEQ